MLLDVHCTANIATLLVWQEKQETWTAISVTKFQLSAAQAGGLNILFYHFEAGVKFFREQKPFLCSDKCGSLVTVVLTQCRCCSVAG